MRFTKMEGLGNDYVYLDCTKETPAELPELARRLSDRHRGIGGDGLICICPSRQADFRMRIFNADGSEGEMCGNGIRCVGKFIRDKGLSRARRLRIETLAGVRELELLEREGRVTAVTVDMGEPVPEQPRVLHIAQQDWEVWPVSMGNPHAVTFLAEPEALEVQKLGPQFEHHSSFPNRTNTEFVEVLTPQRLKMRVWERGSGETLACGTGACAALAAAVLSGRTARCAEVELPGGVLDIRWDMGDNHIYMTGPAVTVFEGDYLI